MALAEERWRPPNRGEHQDEFTDIDGANELKARIEAYWAKRGHVVQIMLVDAAFHPVIRATRYDLRSSMVDGWPRVTKS